MAFLNPGGLNLHNRVVSRHQQTRLTYDALDYKSTALAHGLMNVGVGKGDRVAVSLGNNIENAIVCDLDSVRECSADRPQVDLCSFQTWGYLGELNILHFLDIFYWSWKNVLLREVVPFAYICSLLLSYILRPVLN